MSKKRKILIIANGQSALQGKYGNEIDEFSVIGRINNYEINGYSEYVGSKTNIWFNGANQGLKKRKNKPQKIVTLIPSHVQKKITNLNKLVNRRVGIVDEECIIVNINKVNEYEMKLNTKRVTTGTMSILWSLENFEDVYIYGFDFFIKYKSHYFDNKLKSFLKDKGVIPKAKKHDMVIEKQFVENLIDNKKIKLLNE